MSYTAKFEKAQTELSKTGIWKSNSNPPILIALRKLGFKVRPFHYNSFLRNFITASMWFGCALGLLLWFTMWNAQQMPISAALLSSASSGVVFGGIMAFYYKTSASRNGLSSWEEL